MENKLVVGGREGVTAGETRGTLYSDGAALHLDGSSAFKHLYTCCRCCCCAVTPAVSNSVRPHRRQPTRLPRPWESPGKNTGVGCHFLLHCMKVKSEREVAQSCLTLRDPMDCSPPGPSVHGVFQARVLEWGAMAFSNLHLLQPGKKLYTHIVPRPVSWF